MAIDITPLEATLGAVVQGVSLKGLDRAEWRAIDDAFNEYAVLVFPGQFLSKEEQVEFALNFGELDEFDTRVPNTTTTPYVAHEAGKKIVTELSNIDPDGVHITDPDHPQTRRLAGNEGWHSDSSYRPKGAKASVLSALEVTTAGGHTEFADMRAAYDELSAEMKQRLDGRRAWHSIVYSQSAIGAIELTPPDDPSEMPGAEHPLVRTHPETGRKSLFIGRHASAISGMPVADAQALIAALVEAACQPPRVYSHTWSTGDVVVWDNRCTLHRATAWDLNERRWMRHVRVVGSWDGRDLPSGGYAA